MRSPMNAPKQIVTNGRVNFVNTPRPRLGALATTDPVVCSDVVTGGAGRPELRIHKPRLRQPDFVLPDAIAAATANHTVAPVAEDHGPEGDEKVNESQSRQYRIIYFVMTLFFLNAIRNVNIHIVLLLIILTRSMDATAFFSYNFYPFEN